MDYYRPLTSIIEITYRLAPRAKGLALDLRFCEMIVAQILWHQLPISHHTWVLTFIEHPPYIISGSVLNLVVLARRYHAYTTPEVYRPLPTFALHGS